MYGCGCEGGCNSFVSLAVVVGADVEGGVVVVVAPFYGCVVLVVCVVGWCGLFVGLFASDYLCE